MRARSLAAPIAAAALLFTTACGLLPGGGGDGLFGERRARPLIRIEVTNLNFQDATLPALRGGERQRLGTVSGKGTAVYTIEWRTPLPLQIEIDLLAGGECTTRPITLDPGDEYALQIEVDIRRTIDCAR